MDPTSNLLEQLMLARRIVALGEALDALEDGAHTIEARRALERERADAADRLAELVLALDEWCAKGNALPDRWMQKEPCHYCKHRDAKASGGHCSNCGAG